MTGEVKIAMRIPRFVLPLLVLFVAASIQAAGAGSDGSGGAPRFLSGPSSGDPLTIALDYVQRNRQQLGLTASDLADVTVTDRYVSQHTGVTHIYLRQRYRGVEVFDGNINVNVAKDGSVINLGNSFVGRLAAAVNSQSPNRTAEDAVRGAAGHLGLTITRPLVVREARGGPAREVVLSDGGVSLAPIPAKLVYERVSADRVHLAWNLEIYELGAQHWWNLRVDAASGQVLGKTDYVANDGYRVFALPKENPDDGNRTLERDPAAATASPFAWHDTDGSPGAEFTITRGNNVHAYTDVDANNKPDPGSEPDGGARLIFDFPLDLSQQPESYRAASVGNLFYWNNVIHDVFHGYGFDEAAGNFQVNNYDRGGRGSDAVLAEAQDGSGLNNANFATPPEGSSPRMQMFVWVPPVPNVVRVNPPSPVAGDYAASGAAFGPQLLQIGPLTGDVALANDGGGASPTDACESLVGFPEGKLALVDRGTCFFVDKVRNAQRAGAIGVIVANNAAGSPFLMGAAGPTNDLRIPAVMVSRSDGSNFKANLPFNATLQDGGAVVPPRRDSDLDAGVIAHEYGHGISNRLTGGPSNVACLSNDEQMGEGWSDWIALALTTRSADKATTARGIGNYVIYEPASGIGIRPTPYSTDLAIDPVTYRDIGRLAVPHGVGYAWASMLWEVYWNLVAAHGFNADVYGESTTGGNNLAIQLVMDGMKLQPCSPGFVDGRDAILLADQVLTGGQNQCPIWRGFAKRGLGFSARQGSSKSTTDGTEAFDLPVACATAP